jgi:glyoxylase-like metal-dependent hydrolase (beta-lactamase superfamily II)
MKVQEVGTRGFLFTFDDPYRTNVYAINGEKYLFICDTFLGPDPMKEVLKFLKDKGFTSKPIVVFNSHHDYDHIWGNQLFKDSIILAHNLCRTKIEEIGESDLKDYKDHKKGDVEITLPNTLFSSKVLFIDEGVEFFHSPGHTDDSSSCYDQIDEVLFVGDNIESPYPYLRKLNIAMYSDTLDDYISRNPIVVICGHDDLMFTDKMIRENLEYLKNFAPMKIDRTDFTKKHRGIHYTNLTTIGKLLKEKGKNEESLEYYKEARILLDEAEQSPRVEDLKVKISEIIKELSKK